MDAILECFMWWRESVGLCVLKMKNYIRKSLEHISTGIRARRLHFMCHCMWRALWVSSKQASVIGPCVCRLQAGSLLGLVPAPEEDCERKGRTRPSPTHPNPLTFTVLPLMCDPKREPARRPLCMDKRPQPTKASLYGYFMQWHWASAWWTWEGWGKEGCGVPLPDRHKSTHTVLHMSHR